MIGVFTQGSIGRMATAIPVACVLSLFFLPANANAETDKATPEQLRTSAEEGLQDAKDALKRLGK